MAIDKSKARIVLEEIENIFETVAVGNEDVKKFLKDNIMGPALEEIRKLVEESRPPIIYLIGRSGHGKSSLINALANKRVANVGDIKPTTPESVKHLITFEGRYSNWIVIDSRGLFETTTPEGAKKVNVTEMVKDDIKKYKPDIILHVISAPEVRNLANDLEVFSRIMEEVKKEFGVEIPTIIIINKVDILGNPREWPPESFSKKAGLIFDCVSYITNDFLKLSDNEKESISSNLYGFKIISNKYPYRAVIPVCSLENDHWNVDNLSYFIGNELPEVAQLEFFQAQRRQELLKKVSNNIIKRFSQIAGGVGASPIPISDIVVLTPLQLLLISIIGSLSCRELSLDTAKEYLTAAGITIGTGAGIRYFTQQVVKLVPVAGWAISGAIAGLSTYTIGKAAETYFFTGEIRKPENFKDAWEKIHKT